MTEENSKWFSVVHGFLYQTKTMASCRSCMHLISPCCGISCGLEWHDGKGNYFVCKEPVILALIIWNTTWSCWTSWFMGQGYLKAQMIFRFLKWRQCTIDTWSTSLCSLLLLNNKLLWMAHSKWTRSLPFLPQYIGSNVLRYFPCSPCIYFSNLLRYIMLLGRLVLVLLLFNEGNGSSP